MATMEKPSSDRVSLVQPNLLCLFAPAVLLFALTFLMRMAMHGGFLMSDDSNVVAATEMMLSNFAPTMDQLHFRFGIWLLHYLSCLALGVNEFSLFLPLWIVSAAFPPAAYWLLKGHRFSTVEALFGGLFVAVSPFEMLIGTCFANDPYLSVSIVYAYLAWSLRERFPRSAGAAMAVLLWFGFYNKAWVVYLFPLIGLQGLIDYYRGRTALFWLTFIGLSAVIHVATAGFFWLELANPVPWFYNLPAHYPVPPNELKSVLLIYPELLFIGYRDIGNTLFGVVPYLWLLLIVLHAYLRHKKFLSFNRFGFEIGLIWVWMFLLIALVPNHWSIEEYRSAPRIFRYLHPISFFLSLHTAKLLIDVGSVIFSKSRHWFQVLLAAALLALLSYHGFQATAPGRSERWHIDSLVEILEEDCPPALVMESWLSAFFRRPYLKESCPNTKFPALLFHVAQQEKVVEWLSAHQDEFEDGTMLVTGLGGHVYYRCIRCFIPEEVMAHPVLRNWEMVAEIGVLEYHELRPTVKLWRYNKPKVDRENTIPLQDPS